jgi:transposase
LDNCRIHFPKATEQFIIENHIARVPHPPYSADLAPLDFWPFRHVKNSLVGRTFDEPEQLLEPITKFLTEIQPAEVLAVLSHWVERVWWVLENNGDCYHE